MTWVSWRNNQATHNVLLREKSNPRRSAYSIYNYFKQLPEYTRCTPFALWPLCAVLETRGWSVQLWWLEVGGTARTKVFNERLLFVHYVLFAKAGKYPNSLYNDFQHWLKLAFYFLKFKAALRRKCNLYSISKIVWSIKLLLLCVT